jgi:hypothetical protein
MPIREEEANVAYNFRNSLSTATLLKVALEASLILCLPNQRSVSDLFFLLAWGFRPPCLFWPFSVFVYEQHGTPKARLV